MIKKFIDEQPIKELELVEECRSLKVFKRKDGKNAFHKKNKGVLKK